MGAHRPRLPVRPPALCPAAREVNSLSYAVTLIPGDGIGPELAEAARQVLEATGIGFEWDVQQAGEATIRDEGTPLPDRVIESIRSNGVAIKGPITTPIGSGFRSV